MDQERFDQLARKISSASTRRTMLGGMMAGLFGAGIAKLGDAAAKTKQAKTKHKKVKTHSTKKGKDGSVHKEQIILCSGLNDAVNCPNGCCQAQGNGSFFCLQNGRNVCGIRGGQCTIPAANQCCDPNTGVARNAIAGNPGLGIVGECGFRPDPTVAQPNPTGGVCQPCPAGCCAGPAIGEFGTQCKANGSGNCGLFGVACNALPFVTGCGATSQFDCCTASGNCANGANPGTVTQCGASRQLCKTCTGTNATCISGTCQAASNCPAPQTDCSGTCIDLGNNASNCGKCGNVCPACPTGSTANCTAGTCGCTATPSCPVGLTDCSGVCADLGTNPSNCGKCGTICPDCGKGKQILCNGGACGCSQKKKKKKKNKHHHHH